jgi:hypothetical protein
MSENGSNTQGQMITIGWTRAHIQFYQATAMHNWILLDNQSTAMIFCNPKMVSLALTINAGVLLTNKKAMSLDGEKLGTIPKSLPTFSFSHKWSITTQSPTI